MVVVSKVPAVLVVPAILAVGKVPVVILAVYKLPILAMDYGIDLDENNIYIAHSGNPILSVLNKLPVNIKNNLSTFRFTKDLPLIENSSWIVKYK